jgi:putative tryptophan/tyrosine transport system substrate-binding protein
MKRREFITLLGGAAAAWPLAARAQQASGRPLIGVLSPLSPAAAARNIEALRAGLRDLGYVEDRNVTLALRFAGGVPARLSELAAELVALKPDVILAGSIGGILAARNATRAIPLIMMVVSEDPVALGLINSITRPGGNITGIWMFADDSLVGKRLEFLKHVVPGLMRIEGHHQSRRLIRCHRTEAAAGRRPCIGHGLRRLRGAGAGRIRNGVHHIRARWHASIVR